MDNANLIFNEHYNYGESTRTLRSFIADVTNELCNFDKQPISTIDKTKEWIEVRIFCRGKGVENFQILTESLFSRRRHKFKN